MKQKSSTTAALSMAILGLTIFATLSYPTISVFDNPIAFLTSLVTAFVSGALFADILIRKNSILGSILSIIPGTAFYFFVTKCELSYLLIGYARVFAFVPIGIALAVCVMLHQKRAFTISVVSISFIVYFCIITGADIMCRCGSIDKASIISLIDVIKTFLKEQLVYMRDVTYKGNEEFAKLYTDAFITGLVDSFIKALAGIIILLTNMISFISTWILKGVLYISEQFVPFDVTVISLKPINTNKPETTKRVFWRYQLSRLDAALFLVLFVCSKLFINDNLFIIFTLNTLYIGMIWSVLYSGIRSYIGFLRASSGKAFILIVLSVVAAIQFSQAVTVLLMGLGVLSAMVTPAVMKEIDKENHE